MDRPGVRLDRTGFPLDSAADGPFSPPPFDDTLHTYDPFGSPFLLQGRTSSDPDVANTRWAGGFGRNVEFDITRVDRFLGVWPGNFGERLAQLNVARDTGGRITEVRGVDATAEDRGGTSISYKSNGQVQRIAATTPVLFTDFVGADCFCGNQCPRQSCSVANCEAVPPVVFGKCLDVVQGFQTVAQTFEYDARGLVASNIVNLRDPSSAIPGSTTAGTFQYTYDPVGRNLTLSYPGGHRRTQTFDALGRLTSRCYSYADGSPEHCYTAQYDAIGNPKVLSDPDMRQEIEYDGLDRVTEVRRYVPANATVPAHVETYAYNALGALSVNDGVSVDDRRPRLGGGGSASAGIPATFNGQSVGLDSGGRVTSLNGLTLRYYKTHHLLKSVTSATSTETYLYDALERLMHTHHNPTGLAAGAPGNYSRAYHYAGLGASLSSTTTSTVNTPTTPPESPPYPQADFAAVYDGIDHPLWAVIGSATYIYEIDAIGNVRHLHAGQRFSQQHPDGNDPNFKGDKGAYAYAAFGRLLTATEPGGQPFPPIPQPFTWQGHRAIAPNLYDFRARVWSADLGAFLQPDEYIFLLRGGTLWSWPGQNPFRWRDPGGRSGLAAAALGEAAVTVLDLLEGLPTGVAANTNAFSAASRAGAGGTAGAALAAAVSLSILAHNVHELAREMYAQQDANLNAIAKAAAKARAAGGGNGKEPPDEPECEPGHGHHSDPKFMGGDESQPLTQMSAAEHRALHRDLNRFLEGRVDASGNNMRPTTANPGRDVRQNFTRQERLQALSDFYRGPGSRYASAARDFFMQHPHF